MKVRKHKGACLELDGAGEEVAAKEAQSARGTALSGQEPLEEW